MATDNFKIQGNIDLNNRPIVQNDDGSISTVRTISFEDDRGVVLVPTVSDEGTILGDDEAIDYWNKKDQHLGVFSNQQDADLYAKRLSSEQDAQYSKQPKEQRPQSEYEDNLLSPGAGEVSSGRKAQFNAFFGIQSNSLESGGVRNEARTVSRKESFRRFAGYSADQAPYIPQRPTITQQSEAREIDSSGSYDWGTFDKIAHRRIESGGNPKAKNPNSSALGLGQITAGTWKQYAPGIPLSERSNPEIERPIAKKIADDYVKQAERDLGRRPTNLEAYYYWFLGPNDAKKFVNANSRDLATDHVSKAAARSNKTIFYKNRGNGAPRTIAEVKEYFANRWNKSK